MGSRIAIIGDGAMATVCTRILAANGCDLRLWSAFADNADRMRATGRNDRYLPGAELPAGLEITAEAAEAFVGADLALSAVPTQFVRGVWQRLAPHCPDGLPVCSATKGIENDTLLRPSQIIAEVLAGSPDADRPLAAISGPNIAHELVRELPATVVAAAKDEALAADVQRLFTTPYLRVYTNSDIVGVEIAAATKNIIAIAAGILDGIKAGDNAKAALITRGLVEITRLGVALGGRAETFSGLAGLGDLVTTCISPHGRNRSFGDAVGRGRNPQDVLAETDSVVEGVATARSVLALAARHGVEMPIVEAVHAVIFEARPPADAVAMLMSRRPKREDQGA